MHGCDEDEVNPAAVNCSVVDPTGYDEEYDVLGVSGDLHAMATGSLDASLGEAQEAAAWLAGRLRNWKHGPEFTAVYDGLVFSLATQALAEFREYERGMDKP